MSRDPSTNPTPALLLTLTLLASIAAMPSWATGDAHGPTTTIALDGTPGDHGWWTTTVTTTLTCDPEPCDPEYRLDSGAWTPYAGPFTLTTAGSHTLEARATDESTTGPTTVTTIHIDLAPPQTQGVASGPLGDNGWLTGPTTVTLPCTDDASGCSATQYSLDGAPAVRPTGPIEITDDGNHQIRYRSTDIAGHRETTHELGIPIDSTPPSVAIIPLCSLPGNDDWCRTPVTIATAASDDTSGVVTTNCRLDDQDVPCHPFDVTTDGTHPVAMTAHDAAGHSSSSSALIAVDATPPTIAFTASGPTGPDGTFIGPATIHATCSDATSGCATMHLDDTPDTAWSGTLTIDADGTHTIAAFARDTAGNTGPSASIQVTIDTSGPTPTHSLTGPRGDGDWFTGPTSVTLDCRDDGTGCTTITYRLNDATAATYDAPFTIAGEAIRHTVDYAATDAAGNTGPTHTIRFGLDATPPTVQVHTHCATPGQDGWCREGLTWRVDVYDATSRVRATECRVDDVPLPCESTWAVDGAFTLSASATDHAGWATTTALDLRRDAAPPAIDFGAHCPAIGGDGWCGAPVTLDPHITDDVSGVDVALCLEQGVATACDDLVAAHSGATTFTIQATDHAGNGDIDTSRYLVDLAAPDIAADVTCASGWHGDWCAGSVGLRVLAADGASGVDELVCLLDGTPVPCRSHTALGDGRHDLVVQARDRAGHVASRAYAFGIDTVAPTIDWSRPATGCTYVLDEEQACGGPATLAVGPLTLVASGNDTGSGIARLIVTIDDRVRHTSAGPAFSWTWSEPEPVNAHHRVAVIAEDTAGNRASVETRILRAA